MFNYLNYSDFTELKHRKTLQEIVEEKGYNAIFAGTDVDAATQTALISYFAQDRINAPFDKWQWQFKRNLNTYYPVYKDELEMWEERKTKEWFFDNVKSSTLNRDITQDLDETTQQTLTQALTEAIQATMNETATLDRDNTKHGTGTTDVSDSGSQTQNGSFSNNSETDDTKSATETTNKTTAENSKNRNFGFNYPESNYQGGVIPYDLTNNPSVEFINSQADRLDNKNVTENGTRTNSETGRTESEETGTNTVNNTDSRTTNTETETNITDNTDETATKAQTNAKNTTKNDTRNNNKTRALDVVNNIIETRTHQGNDINMLADQLIKAIPAANFFKQFTAILYKNFQQCYLVDEILEEMEED